MTIVDVLETCSLGLFDYEIFITSATNSGKPWDEDHGQSRSGHDHKRGLYSLT